MPMSHLRIVIPFLLLAVLAACTSNRDSSLSLQCSSGLNTAFKELKAAEAKGLRGTADLTQAASLLAAAKVQYEFKRHPNCVDKVRRARIHISLAQNR